MALPQLARHTRPAADDRPERGDHAASRDRGAAPASPRNLRRIVAAGLLLEILLILSFIPAPLIPLTADSGMDELVPWLEMLGQPLHARMALLEPWIGLRTLAIVLQMILFLAVFIPYGAALRALRAAPDAAAGRVVLLFGAAFAVSALCSRRLFSTDLFSYVLNGRITGLYGGNPYVDVPAQFPDDPYVPLVVWREVPNHYGPLWTFVSVAVTRLGEEELAVTLLLFRLVTAVASVAAAYLIWRLLQRSDPERAAFGTALWAWNPLVILESGGSGHNDAVLGLLLLLAFAALVGRRAILGLLALAAALLVKYSAAVLAPLYLVVLLRRAERRRVALGVLVASALVMLSFLPFRSGGQLAVGVYVSSPARYVNSPTELVYSQLRAWLGEDSRMVVERVEFRPWWGQVRASTDLLLDRGAIPIGRVEENDVVLATDRSDGRWQPVYDPRQRLSGHLPLAVLRGTGRPSDLPVDPELEQYERGPSGTPVANAVNTIIRGLGWLVVGLGLIFAMRSAVTPDDLARGWLLLLTLVYWFTATWFFPWYLIWGLAVAALRPFGPLVWALLVWSASVFLYYGIAPYEWDPVHGWLYRWRVLPMFVPPLAVLAWHVVVNRRRRGVGRALPRRATLAERPTPG